MKIKRTASREKNGWRIVAAAIGLTALAILLTGFKDGPQKLVEEEYIVQEGDTLWDISEMFLEKNTGGRRYILEFKEGIRELNPELRDTATIYPGQVIRINYWVKP